ncbi:MAG: HAMP domain-containing sensor histidine kinase, partial [Oscillospiraceae bacterium]
MKSKEEKEKKKGKMPVRTLRYTIWLYFMGFIASILVLLWLFQIVFLQSSYQQAKIRDIQNVASTVLSSLSKNNYPEILGKTAYDNNMCIEITNEIGLSIYSADMMAGSCELHGKASYLKIAEYINDVRESEDGVIYLKINNERFKTNTILFGMRIGNASSPKGYIFLNTSLDPLGSTIDILKEQMVYITLITLILGSIVSFYIAKIIALPIVRITKSAEDLGKGNYNIVFDGKGYDEIETLASTLNYASTEISKVDNLRRDLIANISHDLRTPLTMVKAYAEMIRDLSGDNPEKRAEHINVIIDESDRLAALVNDILDLSKIESGNNTLNITEFGIQKELVQILERYKVLSERANYVFNLESDGEIMIKADVIKLEQVIYNLINNAVNYSGESKTVTIRQINLPKCVRIEIIDYGKGIPQDMLPLIFDRYYRVEKNKR